MNYQTQFLSRKSVSGVKLSDLEALGRSGQLEYSEDPGDPEHEHDPPHLVQLALLGPLLRQEAGPVLQEAEAEVVGEDGEHVHHVQRPLHEVELAGGARQPQQVLHGEPGDADSLYQREYWVLRGFITMAVPHLATISIHITTIHTVLSIMLSIVLLTLNSGMVLRHMATVERMTSTTDTSEITW